MALILNIDTSAETASVSLSNNGSLIKIFSNNQPKDHASFIQQAIKSLLLEASIDINDLSAIAVTEGPGSYTGLRIGMASAKGLCYALNIPLITLSTLKVMTNAAIIQLQKTGETIEPGDLFCPMIDARREEVFTAVIDKQLEYIIKPTPLILTAEVFIGQLSTCKIFFYGSGSFKFKKLCNHPNAQFIHVSFNAMDMIFLAHQCFSLKTFADFAYTEPYYGKDFHSSAKI
ncbi:MAG: tRNA (adenosine(37)-N6)-threonylcarbamoyltransferase complex dimerization subunit type 1 TsaB [Sphingobacteriales bacterium]|nr:tRNA (adenosine(37)-N6)-threonylcarbamoyltransferase complex dimerization subunit type 1 TsaB [Sphingobacteriales bacterium]